MVGIDKIDRGERAGERVRKRESAGERVRKRESAGERERRQAREQKPAQNWTSSAGRNIM